MGSISAELQKLYFDTLKADPAITAIAGGVYDKVPENPYRNRSAYISFGAEDGVEDDAECISGLQITSQIDVWSKAVGQVEAKRLTDLVRRALHRRSLELTDNALCDTWVSLYRVFPDRDRSITHGVVQVTALVEEI